MQADGLHPVLVESGQPGHLHLFCRITDPAARTRYLNLARQRGIDVRQGHNRIRPPLSPHRNGLPVRLLTPEDPQQALAALAPERRAAGGDGRPPRPLPPEMAAHIVNS
jgi:hypothetical protein